MIIGLRSICGNFDGGEMRLRGPQRISDWLRVAPVLATARLGRATRGSRRLVRIVSPSIWSFRRAGRLPLGPAVAFTVVLVAVAGTAAASVSLISTAHPIPGGGLNRDGVTTLCHDSLGFTCTGARYDGTASQENGNGWTSSMYWTFGSPGPNGTKHNCTTYAAYRLKQNGYAYPGWTDNANNWGAQAAAHHVAVDQTPGVGSIAQWTSGAGHVAYVEVVTSTYIETTSDSFSNPGQQLGTDHLRILRTSKYMPDDFLHFKDIPQSAPTQPANPRVTSTTGSTATLAWTDTSDNETAFVSQYRTGNGAWVAGPSVGANATSMTISGLATGTPYTFQVGAQNAVGTRWSTYFYGSTVSLPAEPTNARVVSTTSSSAALAWTDRSNNESGFVSQYKIGNGSWVAGPSVGANSTSMTVSGLAAGTTYTFQVGAQNSAGTHWSAYFTGATPQVLPAQPTNPRVTSTTPSSAALTWTDASNNETGFVSQYKIGNGSWVGGPSVGANATSMTIGGLRSGTSYTFQVGARNSAGTHWSVYFYGTTGSLTLPAQPANPRVTSTSSTSAALTWTDASNNEDSFVSQYKIGNGSWAAGPSAGADATSMTVGGLRPGTSYTFQVGAKNSVGTHWSVYFYGTTPSGGGGGPVFTVMNTNSPPPDGVWFRNSPHTNDTDRVTGHGVYMNERVQLTCYAWGDAVGPANNQLWYLVTNLTRPTNAGRPNTGYLNAHYINDGKLANQIDAGVPPC